MVFLVLECRLVLHCLISFSVVEWINQLTRLRWWKGTRGGWKVDARRLLISYYSIENVLATHSAEQHMPHEQQHPTDGDYDACSPP
jgi:hypothetical protein